MQSGGNFKFNFFRMGEWNQVEVDRILPKIRRSNPSKTNEWWVPLAEKAYAKEEFVTCFKFFSLSAFIGFRVEIFLRNKNSILEKFSFRTRLKLNGSYDNIDGGQTRWALTELTGGIAGAMDLTWENVHEIGVENFKDR